MPLLQLTVLKHGLLKSQVVPDAKGIDEAGGIPQHEVIHAHKLTAIVDAVPGHQHSSCGRKSAPLHLVVHHVVLY